MISLVFSLRYNNGWAVSLSWDGSRVAIGALDSSNNGEDSGTVRVFELSSGSWSQLDTDIDGEASGDFSGVAVSLP
jgi:hypothetical protein